MAGRKKGVKIAPEGESKADKFKRLAEYRVSACIKRISQVSNLGNPQYEYTEDYAKQVMNAITTSVDAMHTSLMRRFQAGAVKGNNGFKLD